MHCYYSWLETELDGIATASGKRDRVHQYLRVFKAVHGLHDVSMLRFIFFSAAGNPGILSQAGKPIPGGVEEL